MVKLSVVLATYNEEENLAWCLDGVKGIASEIIIVDGFSNDRTVQIAKSYGALVIETDNHPNFHINKQKAIEKAKYPWILQLDADEKVSASLANEILEIINMSDVEIAEYQEKLTKKDLFLKHQQLIEERDGIIGDENEQYAGFFIPRLNFFLGDYLRHGGVYPDGVIRLIKNGQAYLPAKNVHEQMKVLGKVGWLEHDLLHKDSPTFRRYLARNSRYIDLMTAEMKKDRVAKNLVQILNYFFVKPCVSFGEILIRHKGILDGWRGIVWAFFSSIRFARAYWRYL